MNRTQCLHLAFPLRLGASSPIIFNPALCARLPYSPIKAKGGLLRGSAVTSARRMAALPDVRARMAQLGIEPEGGRTEDCARTIATEIPRWTGVARANTIKAE